MTINIRDKGANGEREIIGMLEPIVQDLLRRGGYPEAGQQILQRNQNQSAVGGADLVNTFGLCIEIKRQETLLINTWWQQVLKAANGRAEHPVLLYRGNRKPWRCVTQVWLKLPGGAMIPQRADFEWEGFVIWFHEWVRLALLNGTPLKQGRGVGG